MDKRTVILSLLITLISVTASLTSVSIYANTVQKKTSQGSIVGSSLPPASTSRPAMAMVLPSFEDAAEHSINAVVHVRSEFVVKSRFHDEYFGFFNPWHGRQTTRRAEGFGSGVVISSDGYIITNNHVVQGADLVEITFNNRRTFPAKIIGTDPTTDIALLKIEAKNLHYLTFGDSDLVRVGQWVLAVGNPFNLNSTVTAGIVSAKARNMNVLSRNMVLNQRPIESFIQTDAAVNRGNSGGALVNLNGELIGINTAIASNNGAFSGYSFAIPANIAKKVSEDLRTFGQIQRAFFGILFAQVDQEIVEANRMDSFDGLVLVRVTEDGPAFKAGLRVDDILLKINGRPINTEGEFFEIAGILRPGETVELTYMRRGQVFTANALLQDIEGGTAKRIIKHW